MGLTVALTSSAFAGTTLHIIRESILKTRYLILKPKANLWLLIAVAGLPMMGCGGGAKGVSIPSYDPVYSGEKAMEVYDLDKDGFIADEELDGAPGLKAAIKTLDADRDGKVSESEVVARIRNWQEMRVGLLMFTCDVILDGQPLGDATITFDPDVTMGDAIQQAIATTAMSGSATPKIPKNKRPSPDTPPGIQAGFYQVRISKIVNGKETIPEKYNEKTILGQEVSKDDWAINNRQVRFLLKSK